MNRHQRRAAEKQRRTLFNLNFDDQPFHGRIEAGSAAPPMTMGLGDGMRVGSGWASGVMEAGVVRKRFSLVFRLLVRLLLRPWLLARIHQPNSLWFLGVMARRVGKEQLGKKLIEQAVALDPALSRRKHLAETPVGRTLAEWRAETDRMPASCDAWLGLGNALHAGGSDDEAILAFAQTLKLDPKNEEACANLGAILMQRGSLREAEQLFSGYCVRSPKSARAFNNLGNVLTRLGRLQEAVQTLKKAVSLGPDLVEPINNLGIALATMGLLDEAIACYERANAIRPDMPEVLMNLGAAYQGRGDYKSAANCYLKAIDIRPSMPEAYLNLGSLLHSKLKFVEAETAYRQGLEVSPNFHPLLSALGNLMQNVGEVDVVKSCFERSLAAKEDLGSRIEMAMLSPVVYESIEEARYWREEQVRQLSEMGAQDVRLESPFSDVAFTNFYLAYPGLDDRFIQERLAQFFLKAAPSLGWTAPQLADGKSKRPGKKIRLGVVSTFLVPNHTIGKLFSGLLMHLPRDRFEVVVFRFFHQSPGITKSLDEKVDKVVRLPIKPKEQLSAIAEQRLDVLFYPDIGMAYHTYFMAFARLAPVQVVAWGHPDTTGIPNIDYFVSTGYLDPPGNEAHYSEKLARLALPPCYYEHPPVAPDELDGRKELGLPEDKNLYVCTQTLFKVHPEFRLALKAILERDPKACLVFIDANPYLTRRLSRYLERDLGKNFKRVIFLKQMIFRSFLGLCAAADALLDTFHFSGGNSSLEAFAYGCPIVTLPSQFMRGRVTAQFYKMMEIDDLIANDADHYVELAVRLANDRAWHDQMRERILAAKGVLFENQKAIDHFADFLEKVARGQWPN